MSYINDVQCKTPLTQIPPSNLWENVHIPARFFENRPCSVVAINCALKDFGKIDDDLTDLSDIVEINENGYLSIANMDKVVKHFFTTAKKRYFGKKDRISLFSHHWYYDTFANKRAIVCVEGHYLYITNYNYYSYFNNTNDLVVAIWFLN